MNYGKTPLPKFIRRNDAKAANAEMEVSKLWHNLRCRNSFLRELWQHSVPKFVQGKNYGTTLAVEILSLVNSGNNPVPKFIQGMNYGKATTVEILSLVNSGNNPVPKFIQGKNYGTRLAAIIRDMGVSTAFLGARQAQTFSESRRSKLYQSLSAEFRHRFCHLPYILAFGILALSLTKFVCAL